MDCCVLEISCNPKRFPTTTWRAWRMKDTRTETYNEQCGVCISQVSLRKLINCWSFCWELGLFTMVITGIPSFLCKPTEAWKFCWFNRLGICLLDICLAPYSACFVLSLPALYLPWSVPDFLITYILLTFLLTLTPATCLSWVLSACLAQEDHCLSAAKQGW